MTTVHFTKVDKYFAEHGYADEFCGPLSQEPNQDDCNLAGTAEKSNCNRRHLVFSSQETPPAAAVTEPQIAEVRNIISPNTLKKAVCEQNSIPLQQIKKKGRKLSGGRCDICQWVAYHCGCLETG